jgi:hypothetical protein
LRVHEARHRHDSVLKHAQRQRRGCQQAPHSRAVCAAAQRMRGSSQRRVGQHDGDGGGGAHALAPAHAQRQQPTRGARRQRGQHGVARRPAQKHPRRRATAVVSVIINVVVVVVERSSGCSHWQGSASVSRHTRRAAAAGTRAASDGRYGSANKLGALRCALIQVRRVTPPQAWIVLAARPRWAAAAGD